LRAEVLTRDGLKILDKDSPEYRKTIGEKAYWDERYQDRQELEANRLRRIKNSYKGRVVNLILAVEKAYEAYLDEETEDTFNRLWRLLKKSVDYWAEHFAYNWSGKWFSKEDFEEYFEDEILKEIELYDYWKSPFYLSERVRKRLEGRGYDLVRMKAKTKQGEFEHSLGRFNEFADDIYPGKDNTEKIVVEHILIDQIMNDPSLTEQERKFLQIRYENLDASFEELAESMGFESKVKAWRLMKSIRNKLEKYREDALAYDADAYKWQYRERKKKRRSIVVEVDDSFEDTQIEVIKEPDHCREERNQEALKVDTEKSGKSICPKNNTPPPKKGKKKRKRSEESLWRRNRRRKGLKEITYPPDFDLTSLF